MSEEERAMRAIEGACQDTEPASDEDLRALAAWLGYTSVEQMRQEMTEATRKVLTRHGVPCREVKP